MVPTIDEFGGYCKFDNKDDKPITQVLDIDWNEKIRLLDLDCEKEGLTLNSQSDSNCVNNKRQKIKEDENKNEEPKDFVMKQIEIPDDDSYSTPPKKLKRQRYASDVTNATNSGKAQLSLFDEKKYDDFDKLDRNVNPFQQDNIDEYSFEDFDFGPLNVFGYNSLNDNDHKVSIFSLYNIVNVK